MTEDHGTVHTRPRRGLTTCLSELNVRYVERFMPDPPRFASILTIALHMI